MTSRSLYFNLLWEDMKRRIWTISLSMLVFLFVFPIQTLMRLERWEKAFYGVKATDVDFAKIISQYSGEFLIVVTVTGAIICAISGFFYLYGRNKVDFYHSVPIKREKLFAVSYINGIIIYLVPFAINMILYLIIGAAKGYLSGLVLKTAATAFIVHLTGFLFVYSITVIAVMLTGNLIVGLMGTAIFMSYGPIIVAIKNTLFTTSFYTYYASDKEYAAMKFLSPVFAYVHLYELVEEKSFIVFFIGVLAAIVVTVAIGIALYKIRPSEAAGKSMAFFKTQTVIKFLIVIPTAIIGGIFFMSMSATGSFAWRVFGILVIGFLAHGIIEIIYNIDFRSIISHKIQMLICLGIALAITGIVKADLLHYDNYIPKESSIESVGVSFSGLEPYISYYDFAGEYYDEDESYAYVSDTKYMLDHVKITDIEKAYAFMQYAVENNVKESIAGMESYSQVNDTRQNISFTVRYNLKNGGEKYRRYTVNLEEALSYMEAIYTDENYKTGTYQILTLDNSLIHEVRYFNSVEGTDDLIKATSEQMTELMDTFREELKGLTITELLEDIPVSQLTVSLGDEGRYITQEYLIYPSFTKTIAYMNQLGANLDSVLNPDNIDSITITKYPAASEMEYTDVKEGTADTEAVKTYEFTDREDIEKIAGALILDRLSGGIKYNTEIDYNTEVYIQYKYVGKNYVSAYILSDKLPEDIWERLK
ncbi:DUF6449 domain-containing protein [Konateibacter massiliensis]|uniref:DUF6449 domain-containing protein n=1 Tax=Konateibacter massiliensis TaxID=2002841 RepID=UPI000C150EE9|nr:DUF6449 domain-containing protein [Konateibacter massiliensis]